MLLVLQLYTVPPRRPCDYSEAASEAGIGRVYRLRVLILWGIYDPIRGQAIHFQG